jgi:nitroreductase
MDTFDAIMARRSIRKYKKDKVEYDTILKVTDAARVAPSWGNKQCWRFVIVDYAVEKKIIGAASGQDNIAKACEEAPYIIVLCADESDSGVKNNIEYFMFDCGLAMENLVLAAQNEGLSTCIVGWFDEKAIKAVLNIPENIRVVAFTPVGYADENISMRKRKKASEVVFHNHWGQSGK